MSIAEIKETHLKGFMSVELPDMKSKICDFGIMIKEDGRVWICINNEAFIRFKPLSEKMVKLLKETEI